MFKEFLQTIFQTIEYHSTSKDGMILPRDILALPQDQLISLIDFGLIKKHKYPKEAWCSNCDVVCEVEFVNNKGFLICLECSSQEKINSTNSLHYSSGLTEISEFLQNILGLDNKVETVEDDRLLYLGCKGKTKYYLFCRVRLADSYEILQKISKNQYNYILVLANNHNLENLKTYNILDFLFFKNEKFVLDLPEIIYTNSISALGGKAKADKSSKAREFIIKTYNKLYSSTNCSKKMIYAGIADKLRKKSSLIQDLEDSNLEDFIRKTISKYQKK